MRVYRFGRFGSLLRDDHPLALYAGTRRLSPRPALVLWYPWNWVLFIILMPAVLFRIARSALQQEGKTR